MAVTDRSVHRPSRRPPGRLLVALMKRMGARCPLAADIARTPVVVPAGKRSAPLQALMLAALALPDLAPATAQAAEVEDAQFQFGHYEEAGREFWTGPNGTLKPPQPLRVDTLRAWVGLKLTDRLKLGVELLQDTWSGATPYITTPEGFVGMTGASAYVAADKAAAAARVDRRTLKPLNLSGTPLVVRDRIVNLMTSASAETRNQGRIFLTHEWNDFALSVNARISEEPDYRSTTLGASARWDLDQKRSTLSMGLSRTASRIDANLGPPNAFTDYDLYTNPGSGPRIVSVPAPGLAGGVPSAFAQQMRFRGDRADLAFNLGLTQVLSRNATFSAGFAYAHSSGFLESPHKLVLMGFANPATPPVFNYLFTTLFAMPERRPDTHVQRSWNFHLAHYVPPADAALHLDYAYSRDDWGIKSHTVEAKWVQPLGDRWTVTPKLRYYTQTAADFYQPYFLFRQAYPRDATKPGLLDFSRLPIEYWSSDQRLAGFGARSVGLVVTRQLARDIRMEIGLEEYLRAGRLKWKGDGDGSFGDFRSRMINVGLAFDLQGKPGGGSSTDGHDHHDHHEGHAAHPGADAPAGVMHAHMMDRPGDVMASYGYMFGRQRGRMLAGTAAASDAAVVAGCGAPGCPTAPREMTMHMHMLHLMFAPAEGVNLLLMPQLVSMRMDNRILAGGRYTPAGGHVHTEMDMAGHASGGFGDTTVGVLLRLLRTPRSGGHVGLTLSVPTGSVGRTMPGHGNELLDYGMQNGSGTWDFLPSLTYTAASARWSWGAQASAVVRMSGPNASGYTLGNIRQGTAWIGYRFTDALTMTLRGIHMAQGIVRGQLPGATAVVDASGAVSYPRPVHSSTDVAANYGGRYTDIGVGVSFAVPGREKQGDRIGVEWIAPVRQKVDGTQLERAGSLALNWNMMF